MEAALFTCSICGERSQDICIFCTKDTCANHLCERCRRCSDCCECDVPLTKHKLDPQVEPALVESSEAEFVQNGAGHLDYD